MTRRCSTQLRRRSCAPLRIGELRRSGANPRPRRDAHTTGVRSLPAGDRRLLNKQIAAELGASIRTTKTHRGRVMHKLGVESVAELARLAQKVGVTRLHPAPKGHSESPGGTLDSILDSRSANRYVRNHQTYLHSR